MIKYGTVMKQKNTDYTITVWQGYIQHEKQFYFINNEIIRGVLVSEDWIKDHYEYPL